MRSLAWQLGSEQYRSSLVYKSSDFHVLVRPYNLPIFSFAYFNQSVLELVILCLEWGLSHGPIVMLSFFVPVSVLFIMYLLFVSQVVFTTPGFTICLWGTQLSRNVWYIAMFLSDLIILDFYFACDLSPYFSSSHLRTKISGCVDNEPNEWVRMFRSATRSCHSLVRACDESVNPQISFASTLLQLGSMSHRNEQFGVLRNSLAPHPPRHSK